MDKLEERLRRIEKTIEEAKPIPNLRDLANQSVDEFLQELKEKQTREAEEKHKRKIETSPLYRAYHAAKTYLQRLFG